MAEKIAIPGTEGELWQRVDAQMEIAVSKCHQVLHRLAPIHQATWHKSVDDNINGEIVSEADLQVERTLIESLGAAFPNATFLSEETLPAATDALSSEWCFVIDPIDGTEYYLAGGDTYAISVCLLITQIPSVAILDFPARGYSLTAARGHGAYRGRERIRLSESPFTGTCRLAVSPTQSKWAGFADIVRQLGDIELVSIGATVPKAAAVIEGQVDVSIYLPLAGYSSKIWDYAAADLVVQEAGGKLSTAHGDPPKYDALHLVNRDGLVVGRPAYHDYVCQKLLELGLWRE